MEIWEEISKRIIPKEEYQILLQNGEETGLLVRLFGTQHTVDIFFGAGTSVYMLEEGMIPPDVFEDSNALAYQNEGFLNVIYKIENGKFGNWVKKEGEELYKLLGMKHYVVVVMNYLVEIITQWEPEIKVLSK